MEVLGKIIAEILVSLLKSIQAREDLKTVVRAEMELLGLKDANEAIGWKAGAVSTLDGGATLIVREGSVQINLPGYNPNPGISSSPPNVLPGAGTDQVPPKP